MADLPRLPTGSMDKDRIREMYMASPHVEFGPFARSQGWEVNYTTQNVPHSEWTRDKKKSLTSKAAEELGEAIFGHKSNWNHQVLRALTNLPNLAQNTAALLSRWQTLVNDEMTRVERLKDKDGRDLNSHAKLIELQKTVRLHDMKSLADAVCASIDAVQRSLMIDQWSLKMAESFAENQDEQEVQEAQLDPTKAFVLELRSGEKVSGEWLESKMLQWYDPPQKPRLELVKEDTDAGSDA